MNNTLNKKFNFSPFLYILWIFVILYSIEDMATSTNAYQAQGNRTTVYIYLISVLAILGSYYLVNFKLYTFEPMNALLGIIAWVFLDNLILGNFFNHNRWAALTHLGLVVWWYLIVMFVYNYIAQNEAKEKQLRKLIMLMFWYYCYKFIEIAITNNETYDEATVLNLIYRVIVFVPIISMIKNKYIKNILLGIIFVLTVISMKRGALLVLPTMLLVGSFLDRTKKKNIIKTAISFIIAVVFCVSIVKIINDLSGGFLANRFTWEELKYGSSRSEIYANAIYEMSLRDPIDLFIGIGSGKRGGIHNETLEFLYTFGIFGYLCYLVMFFSMLKKTIRLYKSKSNYASVYGMIFTFIFMVGLYSGVIFVHGTFYIMATLGIVQRHIEEEDLYAQTNWYNHNSR